jgi:hypothetical protein
MGEIIAIPTSGEGLICKIYKEFQYSNSKIFKNEQNYWMYLSLSKTYKWPISIGKMFNIALHEGN